MNICAENPPLRKAEKRYSQWWDDRTQIELIKNKFIKDHNSSY